MKLTGPPTKSYSSSSYVAGIIKFSAMFITSQYNGSIDCNKVSEVQVLKFELTQIPLHLATARSRHLDGASFPKKPAFEA